MLHGCEKLIWRRRRRRREKPYFSAQACKWDVLGVPRHTLMPQKQQKFGILCLTVYVCILSTVVA